MSQTAYSSNEDFRVVTRNVDYIVLFKSVRDSSGISALSNQITPASDQLLSRIYRQATQQSYSYLFINVTQEVETKVQFLSNLFSVNGHVTAWVKNEN